MRKMDRRSWLWRRKSIEKSPSGETDSSASSHSERYFDDQLERLRASPSHSSLSHSVSPKVSSNAVNNEVEETVSNLTEKLSAALLNISAKEDLVKQHAKIAEDAVSGWEKAEAEVVTLKQQLENTVAKNSALVDRISQLNEALNNCVAELHQSREDQEDKITCNCYSNKVQDAHSNSKSSNHHNNLQIKLESAEKENEALKTELVAQYKDIKIMSFERELSNRAAEAASKQYLESIKKVGKLEAECRRLMSLNSRSSNHKPISSPDCIESVTESQSGSGERLHSVDTEPECSDSWKNDLIAALDKFKDKDSAKDLTSSVEFELMDDFLEMERLVALPDYACSNYSFEDVNCKVGNEVTKQELIQLEEKVLKLENEKAELKGSLVDSASSQLNAADDRLRELQAQLDSAVEMKQELANEVKAAEARRNELESRLKAAFHTVKELHESMQTLEQKFGNERALSVDLASRIEDTETVKTTLETQLELALLDAGNLRRTVGQVESELELGKTLYSEIASKLNVSESMLEDANLKIEQLHEMIGFLEVRTEEDGVSIAEIASKLAVVDAEREELELQLSSSQTEAKRLTDKVDMLEEKIIVEKGISSELAVNCDKLESQLSNMKIEYELWKNSCSNDELQIQQEKEIASEKLVECQKTIASLDLQLKSLTNFDEFMKLEMNGELPQLEDAEIKEHKHKDFYETTGSISDPNCEENFSMASAVLALSPSNFSGFTRL